MLQPSFMGGSNRNQIAKKETAESAFGIPSVAMAVKLLVIPNMDTYGYPTPPTTKKTNIWVVPKVGIPQNGWFIMENPIKIDDLGVPLFLETPICS